MCDAFGRDDQMRGRELLLTIIVLHQHLAVCQQGDVVKHMSMALMRVASVDEAVHLDEHVVHQLQVGDWLRHGLLQYWLRFVRCCVAPQ